MKNFKSTLWVLCCMGVAGLSILAFSPLVIPPGQYKPMFAGIPLTLWTGMIICLVMLLLTVLAAFIWTYQSEAETQDSRK